MEERDAVELFCQRDGQRYPEGVYVLLPDGHVLADGDGRAILKKDWKKDREATSAQCDHAHTLRAAFK